MKTIEQLKKEHEEKLARSIELHELEVKLHHLPQFKHVIDSHRKPFVVFGSHGRFAKNPTSKDDIAVILNELTPSNTNSKVAAAGKDDLWIDTPYMIDTKSHVQGDHSGKITFEWEGVEIWVEFPVSILEDWVQHSTRSVTSSEHHYFGGVSMREINEMSIPCFPFIGWCGEGDK